MTTPEPNPPRLSGVSQRATSTVLAGVIGVGLGLWNLVGGGCGSLSLLLGERGDMPDSPFLNAGQQRAVEAFVQAAASLDPVNAAVGALVGLVGLLLIGGGLLQFSGSEQRGLVGRVAFGASLIVDGLQVLWAFGWFALMWGPLSDYVEAIARSMPDKPPDADVAIGLATVLSVLVMALFTLLYFGAKMALAGWALWRCTRADHELDPHIVEAGSSPSEPAPRSSEEGLSWAIDPLEADDDEADDDEADVG